MADKGRAVDALIGQRERLTASIRAKVAHPFHVIKNLFRHRKLRYRGLAKNTAQLFSLLGLANLVIAKRSLLALQARGASLSVPQKRGSRPASAISRHQRAQWTLSSLAMATQSEIGRLASANLND
ncbi:hypothetical protein THIARS_60986 [Thiomonas delicata]|uniref:Transposase IS4-like domain-containing protein n=1 Tax=Thiomonas delicata TaxID=364030 RepID=A0A238D4Q3_THIDL|nr:hypothetical protein THIARS_60986 [Thiomonas delicata]